MKKCARCGYSIEGTPIEIVPFSSSGAKPTTYRHATDADCNEAARKIRVDARRTSRISRYL